MASKGDGPPRPAPHELLRRGTTDHYEDAELYDFEYRDHRHDIAWPDRIAWLQAYACQLTRQRGRHRVARTHPGFAVFQQAALEIALRDLCRFHLQRRGAQRPPKQCRDQGQCAGHPEFLFHRFTL